MPESYYLDDINRIASEIHTKVMVLSGKGRFSGICFGESFTAGLVCSSLVDNPGTSSYILGGITFYHPSIKKSLCISSDIVDNNIISSSCSREAALMTLRQFQAWGTDPEIAISSIGLAEPAENGGGRIFISICSKKGNIIDKEFFLNPGRDINDKEARNKTRYYGTMKALEMILEYIERYD